MRWRLINSYHIMAFLEKALTHLLPYGFLSPASGASAERKGDVDITYPRTLSRFSKRLSSLFLAL